MLYLFISQTEFVYGLESSQKKTQKWEPSSATAVQEIVYSAKVRLVAFSSLREFRVPLY